MQPEEKHLLEKESADGRRAQQLLSDPMLVEFWATLEKATLQKLLNSPDDKTTLRLVDVLRANSLYRQYFESFVQTGQMAEQQLSAMEKVKKLFKAA